MQYTWMTRPAMALVVAALAGLGTAAFAASEMGWLSTCSKCVSPSVFSATGIGTSKAVAQARITEGDVDIWCGNWQPGDKNCVKQQMAAEDLKKVYRASANCTAGTITPVDGANYKLEGVWDKDVGAGRTKWRTSSGKIVARDNAAGGLGIAQQWELLCPAVGKGPKAAALAVALAAKAAEEAAARSRAASAKTP